MIVCPKCNSLNVSLVMNTHYICNNPGCADENGNRVQFKIVNDVSIKFPCNQIYSGRLNSEFYREVYIKMGSLGITETNR